MGTYCEYYDEGLGNNVPREYLKSLSDNVNLLKSEIDKYKKKIDKRTSQQTFSVDNKTRLYETVKNGTFLEGLDSVLHYFGPCSLPSVIYMTSTLLQNEIPPLETVSVLEYKSIPQTKILFDYGMISSDHSRALISNYLLEIYPKFPLLSESFFHSNLMVKNYPESKQIFILLVLLISSANMMRKRMDFVPIKMMLQQKVVELMKVKLGSEDGDSLLCLLLYAIYELLDPEVGKSVWKTVALACAMGDRLQLNNLDIDVPLPGTISRSLPRVNFLKVLVFLDSEISLCLGKPPLISLSKTQISNLQDEELQKYFLKIAEKTDFFSTLNSNSSDCDINTIFNLTNIRTQTDSNLWLLASMLLSHKCERCDLYFDSAVLNILSTSINTISEYENTLRGNRPTLFWISLSNVSIATLNLVIIKRLYYSSYYGIVQDKTILDHIQVGRQLIVRLSSQWYYANTVRSFIDLVLR